MQPTEEFVPSSGQDSGVNLWRDAVLEVLQATHRKLSELDTDPRWKGGRDHLAELRGEYMQIASQIDRDRAALQKIGEPPPPLPRGGQ